jgi:hypothetical protein
MRDVTVVELTSATATMSGMIVPKPPKAPASPESENFVPVFPRRSSDHKKRVGFMLPG